VARRTWGKDGIFFGANEECIFVEKLSYFRLKDMITVPVAHNCLRGWVLDMWEYIFEPGKYKPHPPAKKWTAPRQMR
jgi:hypothetical protein